MPWAPREPPRFAVGMTIAAKPHRYLRQMAHNPDPRPAWLGWGLFYSLWHRRKGVQENRATGPRSLHWGVARLGFEPRAVRLLSPGLSRKPRQTNWVVNHISLKYHFHTFCAKQSNKRKKEKNAFQMAPVRPWALLSVARCRPPRTAKAENAQPQQQHPPHGTVACPASVTLRGLQDLPSSSFVQSDAGSSVPALSEL